MNSKAGPANALLAYDVVGGFGLQMTKVLVVAGSRSSTVLFTQLYSVARARLHVVPAHRPEFGNGLHMLRPKVVCLKMPYRNGARTVAGRSTPLFEPHASLRLK